MNLLRKFQFAVIVLVLCACGNDSIQKAKEYMGVSMYDEAITLLELEIQDNPKNAEAHYLIGRCYLQLGDYNKQDDSFKRAILIEPKYREIIGEIFFNASYDDLVNGNTKSGSKNYKLGFKINPEGKEKFAERVYEYTLEISESEVESRKIISLYQLVLEIDNKYSLDIARNTYFLGEKFINGGFYEDGLRFAEFSIKLDPIHLEDVGSLYFTYSNHLLINSKDYNKSIIYFEKAHKLNNSLRIEISNLYYKASEDYKTNLDAGNGRVTTLLLLAQKTVEYNPEKNSWFEELRSKYSSTNNIGSTSIDNLVAFYPFDGDSKDHSGNNFHARASGVTLTTDRFGNQNSAFSFDGTNDFIDLGSSSNFDSKEGTISIWYKKESSDPSILISDRQKPGVNYVMVFSNTNGTLEYRIRGNSTSKRDIGNVYSQNKDKPYMWYHAVITWGSGGVKGYLNGIFQGVEPYYGTWRGQRKLYLGRHYTADRYFSGSIDDVRVFNKALSEQEVMELYNSTSAL